MSLLALLIGIFILLVLTRVPVAVALLAPVILYLLIRDIPLEVIPQRMFTGVDIYALLAIPLFVTMGILMKASGQIDNLVEFFERLLGGLPGGLAQINVFESLAFAGVSGSAAADAVSLGSINIPMMKQAGYTPAYAVALTAASSIVGPIIPPSIVFIMYGVLAEVSILKLFLAGILPGFVVGLLYALLVYLQARSRDFPRGLKSNAR